IVSQPNTPPKTTATTTSMVIIRLASMLFSLLIRRAVGFRRIERPGRRVPPAAAERLEQSRGIREARGLRLDERDPCLLGRLLGVEQCRIADRAEAILFL